MAKVYTFNPALHHILKAIVSPWFKFRYPFHLTNPEILKEMKGPYILLPNHMMKWDVVLIGLIIKDPIQYMASDAHFREKSKRFFMKKLGTFPKSKAKSDLGAIRHMMSLKEQSKIICIYPQGQMSWDGQPLPSFYSTAKLLKLLKIPAYVPVWSGAYAVQPRWSKGRRKGPIEVTIHPLARDGRSFKGMSTDEIFDKLTDLIKTDEYALIRRRKWKYRSKNKAEYLENMLFLCPECRQIATLRSEGDSISCCSCGFSCLLDDQYSFRSAAGKSVPFENPAAWNEWQRTELTGLLKSYNKEKSRDPFMVDRNIQIKTGYRQEPPVLWAEKGEIALFRDRIQLRSEEGTLLNIPLSELSGGHVLTRQKLEFYHEKTLYIFDFPDIRLSGYKWLCAMRALGLPGSYAWASEEAEKI